MHTRFRPRCYRWDNYTSTY